MKFRRYERDGNTVVRKDFEFNTIPEARLQFDQWKKEWKKNNGDFENDLSYDRFCRELDEFIDKWREDILENSDSPITKNIKDAKKNRENGQSPWKTQ